MIIAFLCLIQYRGAHSDLTLKDIDGAADITWDDHFIYIIIEISCVMTVNFRHYFSETEIDLQTVKERNEKRRNKRHIFCNSKKKCCL